jgi:hypothetical protein
MKRIVGLFLFIGVLLIAGCGSFPSRQLSLDFTAETTPVMLTPVESTGTTKDLHFESGYSSVSVTTSSSRSGPSGTVTTSSTAGSAQNINMPLNIQMQNTLIFLPEWLAVTGLTLQSEEFEFLIMGSISTKKYVLSLDLRTPFIGKE